MRTIHVDVTADDIANQSKADCYDCAIARALCRAFDTEIGEVHVIENHYSLDEGLGRLRRLPIEATGPMRRLDRGEKVEPFSFTLRVR